MTFSHAAPCPTPFILRTIASFNCSQFSCNDYERELCEDIHLDNLYNFALRINK